MRFVYHDHSPIHIKNPCRPTTTHIYKIPLTRPSLIFSPNTVQLLHIIFSTPTEVIRAIDPIRKLIVFSHLNFVNIVCWGNGDQRVALSTQTDDLEELLVCTLLEKTHPFC